MKACSSSSDSLSLLVANGPKPLTVAHVAIADSSNTEVATSRWPKRNAVQISGGMHRKVSWWRLSSACAKTSAPVATTTISRSTASKGLGAQCCETRVRVPKYQHWRDDQGPRGIAEPPSQPDRAQCRPCGLAADD